MGKRQTFVAGKLTMSWYVWQVTPGTGLILGIQPCPDKGATVDDLVRGTYQREANELSVPASYRRSVISALDTLAERRAEIGTDSDQYVWHGEKA